MEEKEKVKEKEKEREEQDKLGPLRPLTPSKSAPVMATVVHEALETSAAESTSQVSVSTVHKSASATPLSLVVHSPPSIRTGLYSESSTLQ